MTTTETQLRDAQRTGDTMRIFAALRRAHPDFVAYYKGLVKEWKAAKVERDQITREQKTFETLRIRLAGHCPRCRDRRMVEPAIQHWGPGDDWRMNDPRPCTSCPEEATKPFSAETIAKADKVAKHWRDAWLPEVRARIDAQDEFRARRVASDERVREAARAWEPLASAAAIGPGAVVAYTNTRARAKFTKRSGGEKVPHGIEGEVFRISAEDDPDDVARFGIRTRDGREFWTSARNCSDYAINGWDRAMGLDPLSVATKRNLERQAEEERATAKAIEAAPIKRGDMVKVEGSSRKQKVFWIGKCKRTGRVRFGAGRNAKAGPFWGYADEQGGN